MNSELDTTQHRTESGLRHGEMEAWVAKIWDQEIVPEITEYIKIPALSPLFDRDWIANGNLARAVDHIFSWCSARPIAGLSLEVIELEGRTPLIFMEIPAFDGGATEAGDNSPGEGVATGDDAGTVLLYGHLDKQPEMDGWREGLGPWEPKLIEGRLYGRGGADDGYSAYASLTAIEAVQKFGGRHPRCVVLIEASEESGSPDLPAHIDCLGDRLGKVELVVCLDSGAGDYERLWSTTSLRGMVSGDLNISILREGVHSGDASGIVPSSFRILRLLLDRIENPATGRLLPEIFHVEIPEQRRLQAARVAEVMGESTWNQYPFVDGSRPMTDGGTEQILARTWTPTLSVIGAAGMPPLETAGNVLRPTTSVKLSFRLPPTADWEECTAVIKEILEQDAPYGAKVEFVPEKGANGWNAPPLAEWLERAVEEASVRYFGNPSEWMGEGGTIPFMGMLGDKFPDAQFLVTGVLGPESNAHGPNEFLHVPTGKKLTACVAEILSL